jgi:hypothetical protein
MTFRRQIFTSCGITAIAAILLGGFDLYAEWFAVSPNGSQDILWNMLFLLFPLFLLALAVILVSVVLLIFRKTRRPAFLALIAGFTYLVIYIGVSLIGGRVRMHGFHKLAQRSAPIVQAIKKFEAEKGHRPNSLEELVPQYLPSIPNTGMGAYPKYEYEVGKIGEWDDNPWVLYVNTPSGGVNWDMFMYFPKQNYPKTGYGGGLERIDDWAYVHE